MNRNERGTNVKIGGRKDVGKYQERETETWKREIVNEGQRRSEEGGTENGETWEERIREREVESRKGTGRERARSQTKAYFCTIRFAAICSFLLQQSSLLCLRVKTIPHDLHSHLAALQPTLTQWFHIVTSSHSCFFL